MNDGMRKTSRLSGDAWVSGICHIKGLVVIKHFQAQPVLNSRRPIDGCEKKQERSHFQNSPYDGAMEGAFPKYRRDNSVVEEKGAENGKDQASGERNQDKEGESDTPIVVGQIHGPMSCRQSDVSQRIECAGDDIGEQKNQIGAIEGQ